MYKLCRLKPVNLGTIQTIYLNRAKISLIQYQQNKRLVVKNVNQ